MSFEKRTLALVVGVLFNTSGFAAVTPEEAKQLGTTLTAFGAEKAGNKDGSIPAWTGERIVPPADFDPKEPNRLPNPWKDKPLFSITAQNLSQYADKMSEGQKALFRKYPNFRMDIYPTRRTAIYPKWVLDNTMKNATSCRTTHDGTVVEGCYGGILFPIPKTGNEVMWNHVARYTKPAWLSKGGSSWLVSSTGAPSLQGTNDFYAQSDLFDPSRTTPATGDTIYWKVRFDFTEPARRVGEKFVGHYPMDPVNVGNRIWQYIPGQRRVKLAPDLAYDTPNPLQGGTSTQDQAQIFLGAQDRYDFKLIGKQEKYIMYNTYELVDYKTCPDEKVLTKNFMNPDCVRWELHRVWVVQATLKPQFRHLLPKRTFYFDEDTAGAGMSDDYDAAGVIYRVSLANYFQAYSMKDGGNLSDVSYTYDLTAGYWSTLALFGKKGAGPVEITPKPANYYSPEALAGEGIR